MVSFSASIFQKKKEQCVPKLAFDGLTGCISISCAVFFIAARVQ
jgi:hypothetical protein